VCRRSKQKKANQEEKGAESRKSGYGCSPRKHTRKREAIDWGARGLNPDRREGIDSKSEKCADGKKK